VLLTWDGFAFCPVFQYILPLEIATDPIYERQLRLLRRQEKPAVFEADNITGFGIPSLEKLRAA